MRGLAVLFESGRQLADASEGGAVANLVLEDGDFLAVFLDGDRSDFVREPAVLLGVLGAAVGLDGILVLAGSGDVEVFGDVLGRAAYTCQSVVGVLGELYIPIGIMQSTASWLASRIS